MINIKITYVHFILDLFQNKMNKLLDIKILNISIQFDIMCTNY